METYNRDNMPIRRIPSVRQSRTSPTLESDTRKRTAEVVHDAIVPPEQSTVETTHRDKIARVPHGSEPVPKVQLEQPVTVSTSSKRALPKITPSEMKAYLTSLGLPEQGEIFEKHHIDSEIGQNLTRDDFLDMGINNLGDRKKILSACENIKHPLFTVFLECDADRSYKIDACELSHMMSRVEGKPFPEATARAMIAEASSSGELDFMEFKEIMEKTNTSDNWHAAQKELTMGTKFLHAGDKVMSTMHEAVRAGTFPSAAAPKGAPVRRIPSLLYRFISFICGNIFGIVFLGILTLGMFFIWATTHVNCRGQQIHQYFFGLKTVGYRNGRVVSWFTVAVGMYLISFFPLLVGFMVGDKYGSKVSFGESLVIPSTYDFGNLLSYFGSLLGESVVSLLSDIFAFALPYAPGTVCNLLVVPACVAINVLTAVMDPEGRLLTDKILGIVVVFN